jgi:hypothetical protein
MKFASLALAGVLAAAIGGPSLAQPAPSSAPSPASAPGHQEGHWRQPDPAEMAQRHAERLGAVLQLRPDQQPALRAFVASLQPDPAKMERKRAQRGAERDLTTPQRLDRMQARLAEAQADFARRADAIRRFYAQLTPSQQRAFDTLAPMMMHRHHGMMRGHRHDGRGMGPGGPQPPVG